MAKDNFAKTIIVGLLFTVGGWAIFSLVSLILVKLVEGWGITDEATQMLILVGIVVLTLSLLGFSFKKSIKKMVA